METDNKQLISLLQGIRPEIPSKFHEKFDELSIFYEKKLWHQLTLNCETLFSTDSEIPKEVLVLIFNEFIQKWSKKMNQLSFTKLAVRVAQLLDVTKAIELLEGLSESIKNENSTETLSISYILAKIEVSQYYLSASSTQNRPEYVPIVRDYIDECIELLESMSTKPPVSVQASVYRISALYDKFSLNYSAFYRHTLLYLACEEGRSRSLEIAHDLCIATLLADDIYNFGEILNNPILTVLNGSKFEFLFLLISAFNAGDLTIFASEQTPFYQAVQAHPALSAHFPFLQEKLCLMSLAHMLFLQIKNDNRHVSFSTISVATGVPIDQIEFLLIRAISCKIIRGIIDQVNSNISVTWIQPRLLNHDQIGELLSAVRNWNNKVGNTLDIVKEMRAKGVFSEATTTII